MRYKTWDKNKSPVGWYVATYVERFAFEGESDNPRRRCRAWKNVILVRATTPEQAYRKALKHATAGANSPWTDNAGNNGKLIFEGFTSLLPVYDELEDGAELMFSDLTNISVGTVKRMVRPKEQLQIFQTQ